MCANPSFHAITKISRILEALAVLMMSINKSVKEPLPLFHIEGFAGTLG